MDGTKHDVKRGRPKTMIVFPAPIAGPSGAKLLHYEWKHKYEDYVDARGEDRARRVSDWDEAVQSDSTGREIVHQFGLEVDGQAKTMSLESAMAALGYVKEADVRDFKSLSSLLKTKARQMLRMEILKSQEAQLNQATAEMEKLPLPPIRIVKREGKDFLPYEWSMEDASTITRHEREGEPQSESARAELTAKWRNLRLMERYGLSSAKEGPWLRMEISDLERRMARTDKLLSVATSPHPKLKVRDSYGEYELRHDGQWEDASERRQVKDRGHAINLDYELNRQWRTRQDAPKEFKNAIDYIKTLRKIAEKAQQRQNTEDAA